MSESYWASRDRENARQKREQRLDLFAAAALTGLLADGIADGGKGTPMIIATDAWTLARAMLDNEPKDEPKDEP